MFDEEENAAIVNALQRRADVVVQKSLAEGFGLTVAEAMWKARPVIASCIGGIQDQIEHGRTGLLLDDPTDLAGFGGLVTELLEDPARAEAMGRRAREAVREEFLGPRHLMQYASVFTRLLDARGGGSAAADRRGRGRSRRASTRGGGRRRRRRRRPREA
jgi:trehalose synthase